MYFAVAQLTFQRLLPVLHAASLSGICSAVSSTSISPVAPCHSRTDHDCKQWSTPPIHNRKYVSYSPSILTQYSNSMFGVRLCASKAIGVQRYEVASFNVGDYGIFKIFGMNASGTGIKVDERESFRTSKFSKPAFAPVTQRVTRSRECIGFGKVV